ncbi:MAG: hypothetical protein KKE50_04925 [Nanoarchaeota archaeon]|nr:hypothetical protein [Nanoarchaeota archaeon]
MIQNSLLKYLKSESKKFSNKDIFDIVIYGSCMMSKEEPKDIDIAVIFFDKKLDERLKIAQEFKEKIKNKIKNSDVRGIILSELFDASFLARPGILAEGYSLLNDSWFSEKIGFKGYMLFTYSLTNLNHNEKTKFTYSLIGRKNKGMIETSEAIPLGKGALIVPIKNSFLFEDFLKRWKVNFKSKKALISE